MNLKHMEFFIVSADMGSFKKASEVLDVTQPYVGRVVHDMEKELQVNLFDRNVTGVVLSEAGKQLYGHISDIVRDAGMLRGVCTESHSQKLNICAASDSGIETAFSRFCKSKRKETIAYQFLEASLEEGMRHIHRHLSEISLVYIPQWQMTAFLQQLEHKNLEMKLLKKGRVCLRVGPMSPLYRLSCVESSVLDTIELVQVDDAPYSMLSIPNYMKKDLADVRHPNILIRTSTDSIVTSILENTDMGNLCCDVFPDSFRQDGLHMVRLADMDTYVYFGYIKLAKGKLSPLANRFVHYLKKILETDETDIENMENSGMEK